MLLTTYAPTPAGFAILTLLFLILFLVSTLSAPKGDTISGAGTSSNVLSGGQTVGSTLVLQVVCCCDFVTSLQTLA